MNMIDKQSGGFIPVDQLENARAVLYDMTGTPAEIAAAKGVLRRSGDRTDAEILRMVEAPSRLHTDAADIAAIDRNLSRGLIREADPVPSVVIWAMVAAVAMAVLFVGLAWADPVVWAVSQ